MDEALNLKDARNSCELSPNLKIFVYDDVSRTLILKLQQKSFRFYKHMARQHLQTRAKTKYHRFKSRSEIVNL